MTRLGVALMGAALLAACASPVPQPIRNAPAGSPLVGEVRSNVERYIGTRVRWGGTIANVANRESETWLEIVARDLQDNARPSESDRSHGRFIARVEGFLDPAIYSNDRQITVVGSIDGQRTRTIDEYEYEYPVVDVESYYLWEPLHEYGYTRHPYYYSPYFYDPFYDPFFYDPFYWRRPYLY